MNKHILFAAAATLSEVVIAGTAEIDGVTYTWADYSPGYITKVESNAKVINIPSEIFGNTIIGLGYGCFKNNATVMKVTLPESLTGIDFGVFQGCVALTSVNVPTNVSYIHEFTFEGCTHLKSISLHSGILRIGTSCFKGCSELERVELSEGLQEICEEAFRDCTALRSVEIPDSVMTIGVKTFLGCSGLQKVKLPRAMSMIPMGMFEDCSHLQDVEIPNGVLFLEDEVFLNCNRLKELVVPASVTSMGHWSICCDRATFLGKPPAGIPQGALYFASTIAYPKEYGALWQAQIGIEKFAGYVNPGKPKVTIVSTSIRDGDPTVLDVVYRVDSARPTIKVRALAFEDGERTFAKVTRPETFIDGTETNLGDDITANAEHKLSWKVSSDLKTNLANIKFEVLTVEEGLLPFELIKIPANGERKAMQLSWNRISEKQVFDALLWLYADKDEGITLVNGSVKHNDDVLAEGDTLTCHNEQYPSIGYVLDRMGFQILTGSELSYANEMTRLGLSPLGLCQYAWRWIEK